MIRLALALALTLAAAPAQDRFLEGVLQPTDVTVRPQVVVKRLPPSTTTSRGACRCLRPG